MRKLIIAALAALAVTTAFVAKPSYAQAQDTTTTPTETSTTITASQINNALIGSGRLGLGTIGNLTRGNDGSVSTGITFERTSPVLTLDLLRTTAPIGALKGQASLGLYLTTNSNAQDVYFGPEVNYSYANFFVGVAYVAMNGENKGEFIIGHRL